ncbi:MAG: hypothetical protein OSB46_16335 [Alphaproteobacteria bacterium]|nr:hypothetical protein [Alphaproteobacteria bacterium]
MAPTLKRVGGAYLTSIAVDPAAAEPLCCQLFFKINAVILLGNFESGARLLANDESMHSVGYL